MKNRTFAIIKVLVSILFLSLLIRTISGKWANIADVMSNMSSRHMIMGAVAFMASLAIITFRLKKLLSAQGLLLKYNEALSLTFIGYFFNNFLPTSMGGDLVKAYYVSKKSADKVECFATVAMDRLVGLFSLFLIGGAAVVMTRAQTINRTAIWSIFAILAILISFMTVLWNRGLARRLLFPLVSAAERTRLAKNLKLEERLKRAYNTLNSLKDKKMLIAGAFSISVAAQLVAFSAVYFWLNGMGSPVSAQTVMMTMPLVSIFSMLPSINGLGIREYAIVFLFGPHTGIENAFALGLLWLFMLFVVSFLGGLNYAFDKQYKLSGVTT